MKKIFFLLSSFFLINCNQPKRIANNEGISLELLNKEVYYVNIDSNLILKSEGMDYEMLKSYTNDERKKAKNIITYKIVNNSKMKICFVLNSKQLDYAGDNSQDFLNDIEIDSISPRRTTYIIDNVNFPKGNKIRDVITWNYPYNIDSLKIYFKKYQQLGYIKNHDDYEDIGDIDSVENLIFLNAGEYKIFKKVLYLPIFNEKDHNPDLTFGALVINPNYKYNFSLAIESDKTFLSGTLPEYKLKEIKDNGYEIFDGKLLSNKIPLILKK